MRTDVYVHADKESMWERGKEIGLSDEACRMFMYACYEIKITLEVNEKTGMAEIVAVNDKLKLL